MSDLKKLSELEKLMKEEIEYSVGDHRCARCGNSREVELDGANGPVIRECYVAKVVIFEVHDDGHCKHWEEM